MSLRSALSTIAVIAAALLPRTTLAQNAAPHATQFWLSGGAGVGLAETVNGFPGGVATATSLGLTVQHHALVTSLRWARTSDGPREDWFAGGMVGVGSPARYAVHGSIAAGLGIAGATGRAQEATVPVELQLGVRLTPAIGLGLAGFAAVTGKNQPAGVTFGLQLGRLW